MTVWDELYFKPGEYHPDESKSAQWNRGAYLVQGPGHCGACHTPKTWLGGDKTSEALRGYALQGWVAPDITSGQGALGSWSTDDVASYLRTGHNRNAAAAGLMAEVVDLSTSRMTDDDIKGNRRLSEGRIGAGCGSCSGSLTRTSWRPARRSIRTSVPSHRHAPDGKGVPNLFPNLSEAATVSAKDPATVLRA